MATEKEEIKTTLLKCLSEQVSEMELFKSMYPNEISLLDGNIIVTINNFLDGKSEYVPKHLDFMLYIQVNDYKLEISIHLPSFYPVELPEVNVRCNQLNRLQETSLNSELLEFITENHNNEVCLLTLISWIQEQVEGLKTLKSDMINNDPDIADSLMNNNFVRMWIFSHHIYNKKKREEIVKLAKELNISGFCLSGKPGIICIEGNEINCKKWWKVIKSLTWKKIAIRKTEIFNEAERHKQQKFHEFEEIHFQNPSSKQSKHSNMSEFSKYIENHGLSHAFNEIFGLSD